MVATVQLPKSQVLGPIPELGVLAGRPRLARYYRGFLQTGQPDRMLL